MAWLFEERSEYNIVHVLVHAIHSNAANIQQSILDCNNMGELLQEHTGRIGVNKLLDHTGTFKLHLCPYTAISGNERHMALLERRKDTLMLEGNKTASESNRHRWQVNEETKY